MNVTRLLIIFLVFAATITPIAVGKAPAFQARRAEAADKVEQAEALERENKSIVVVQSEVAAYDKKIHIGMHGITGRHAPGTLEAETLKLSSDHHVIFDHGLLRGPLATPLPVLAVNRGAGAVPTPPPSGPNLTDTTGAAIPRPTPSSTPIPGFYRAANVANDPFARRLVAFAGSTDIIGSYIDVVGALQDLSRGDALVSIVSASICRDDHDTRGLRTLSVAFRLYGLSEGSLQ